MTQTDRLRFARPYLTERESEHIEALLQSGILDSNGRFTKACLEWLQERLHGHKVLLTPTCTASLEFAMLLAEIGPGDEVIMSPFTFVSMANAVVLRGATPVFVDIRSDTLNIDEGLIEAAVGERTKVIMPMHYAGVACAMTEIMDLARRHDVMVVEDAAHALLADQGGRMLGTIGQLGAFSFDEQKNITSGQGGALVINDQRYEERAQIIHDKGTNRAAFMQGQVDKYTWIDLGTNYAPSELVAALLLAQLEKADTITARRRAIWRAYHDGLAPLEEAGLLARPGVPGDCRHNAHIYYILLPNRELRDSVMAHLGANGILAPFHYVPLHDAPAGRRFGKTVGSLETAESAAARLLRLPLWVGMEGEVPRIVDALTEALRG